MKTIRLAPLAGVTDWPFRLLCFEQGCDCAYTEMVSAMGYVYAPKQRATQELLRKDDREGPLVLQLFGKEPEYMAKAAAELSRDGRFCGIDINMGCPAAKIAGSGEGSGLMRTPALAYDVMKAAVEASALPVSVKMRLGWDDDSINVLELARLAEKAGVWEITVHGRTRMQQYSGTANWEWISRVKQEVGIPVIGNGDITTAAQALDRLENSGTDGIMLARGAMGNPWLFRQIRDALEGREPKEPTPRERVDMILRHYDMMLGWKEEYIAVREMRKHIAWYLHGLRGASQMRVRINSISSPAEAMDCLRDYAETCMEE